MKLDRNTTVDGAGKYGLVKVRNLKALTGDNKAQAINAVHLLEALGVVEITPQEPGDQFFVMRYKDYFTADGLQGYADAINEEISDLRSKIECCENGHGKLDPEGICYECLLDSKTPIEDLRKQRHELNEYADEIQNEVQRARELGNRIPD